jgi:hypothetical protein
MSDSVLEISAKADFGQIGSEANEAAASVEGASSRITAAMNSAGAAPEKLAFSTMEAQHALRGMGEELGVRMPRFVSSFVSHLGGVGPALAMAFTPIAIIGVTKVLIDAGKEVYNLYENVVNLKAEFEALGGIEKALTADMLGLSNSLIQGNVRLTELSSGAIAGARAHVTALGMQIVDLGKLVDVSGKEFKDLGVAAKSSLREFLVPTQAADFANTLKNVGLEIGRVKKLMLNTDEESTEFKGLQESLSLLSAFYNTLSLRVQKYNQDVAIANAEAQKAIRAEQEKTQRQVEQAAKEAARVQHEQIIALLNEDEKNAKEKTKLLEEEVRENQKANTLMDEEAKKAALATQEAWKKAWQEIVKEQNKANKEMEEAMKKLQKPWDTMAKSMQRAMTQTTMGLIEGTMTVQKAFLKLGDGILQIMVNALAKVLAQHIAHAIMVNVIEKSQMAASIAAFLGFQSTKLAAAKTAEVAQGTTDAGLAGAAAYASVMEALPFPVNIAVAPGVAAEAITATMALASFAVGTDYVPRTGLALLHEGEAITPASQNRGGGGGHTFNFNVSAVDAPGVQAFFDQHGEKMARTLSRQMRKGNRF